MQSGLKNTMDTKIPHIIHYCWFGNNPKPKLILKCIDSWKKFHPDWEIREWNENNYDVTKNDYIKEAYAQKKWAFVCDFARFDILNEYGGVFLDTDVEFLRSIPNEFLNHEAFAGFETQNTVNPGLIFASIQEHPILKSIIEDYSHKKFGELIDGKRIENIVDIVTKVLLDHGLTPDNSFQIVDGIAIYPNSIFCCFNHETQHFETTEDTVSVHHYFASWSPWYRRAYFKSIKIAVDILGKDRYLKMKNKILRR